MGNPEIIIRSEPKEPEVKSMYVLRTAFSGTTFIDHCQNSDIQQVMKDFTELQAFCNQVNETNKINAQAAKQNGGK
jgi:hypothetical protein